VSAELHRSAVWSGNWSACWQAEVVPQCAMLSRFLRFAVDPGLYRGKRRIEELRSVWRSLAPPITIPGADRLCAWKRAGCGTNSPNYYSGEGREDPVRIDLRKAAIFPSRCPAPHQRAIHRGAAVRGSQPGPSTRRPFRRAHARLMSGSPHATGCASCRARQCSSSKIDHRTRANRWRSSTPA